jgi:hypothetical protein
MTTSLEPGRRLALAPFVIGNYRKFGWPNVIFLTLGRRGAALPSPGRQEITNQDGRDSPDRYNLSDPFNLETKDF